MVKLVFYLLYCCAAIKSCGLSGILFKAIPHRMADARHTAQKWGFDGVVITDYATTHELIAHGVAENDADVGMDIDMQTSYYCQR